MLFVLGASLVTGVLAGALPALRASKTDLNGALKEGGRNDAAVGLRTRRLLIVCEVSLSLVLLMGAGVMFRTLLALRSVDTGYNPQSVLDAAGVAAGNPLQDPVTDNRILQRRARADASVAGCRVSGRNRYACRRREDRCSPSWWKARPSSHPAISRLSPSGRSRPSICGRCRCRCAAAGTLSDADQEALLVSASAARLLWGEKDPIGTRVTLPLMSKTLMREVVGIVARCEAGRPDGSADSRPCTSTRTRTLPPGWRSCCARPVPPLDRCPRGDRRRAGTLDPGQPVEDILTMDAVLEQTLTSQRFSVLLLGGFACAALSLASVGIYSVLSYIVRGRSREIGIRTALGARTADVVRLVVFEGMAPALDRHRHGIVAALMSAPVLRKLVFGVNASDPLTLFGVAGSSRSSRWPRASCPPTGLRGSIHSTFCGLVEGSCSAGGRPIGSGGESRPAAPGDAAGSDLGVVEQLQGECTVRDRRSGPERGGQEDCFRHFLACRARPLRCSGMHIEAVGHCVVQAMPSAISSRYLRGMAPPSRPMIESQRNKSLELFRCQLFQLGQQFQSSSS